MHIAISLTPDRSVDTNQIVHQSLSVAVSVANEASCWLKTVRSLIEGSIWGFEIAASEWLRFRVVC